MKQWVWCLCIIAMSLAGISPVGCSSEPGPPDAAACPIAGDGVLQIGVPDSITFLNFTPLTAGGDIPLSSNGQTFLAVQVAIKATNIDRFVRIGMTVSYQPSSGPLRIATKDDSMLERLFCRDDGELYLIPVVVSSEMLGDELELQDQLVDISITLTDDASRTVTAQASGVLRRI